MCKDTKIYWRSRMSLRYKIKNGADIVKHFGSTGNVMEKQRITDERIGRVYKSHHEN